MSRENLSAALKRLALSALLVAAAHTASANVVTFDPITGGPWGGAFGNAPGDFIFAEDLIDVGVEEFRLGAFVGFIQANLAPATPDFGTGRVMAINNINLTFKFGAVPGAPCRVQFDYLDQGGEENLRVNGAPLFEGDLPAVNGMVVAPGVVAYVSTIATPSGTVGTVLLDGPVMELWVGGQEFFLDNVRTVCEGDKDCDFVVDHETLAIGDCFGACAAQVPGDLAFVEDGIPVFLAEFLSGGPVLFNFAEIDPPFPFFGKSHIMEINNIDLVYDFAALPCPVRKVTFEFLDLGGTENFSVNGAPIFIGDLPAAPPAWPPDVMLNVSVTPIGFGIRGEAVITGTIDRMRLGGQEFWVDNVCAECEPIAVPDGALVASGARLAPLPNPFAANETVRFSIDVASAVTLAVYDVRGALVKTIADGTFSPGDHDVTWDGRDTSGARVGPGAYFVRLVHERGVAVRKIVLVR